ncbi:BRD4-interacting chromatin-remodeling complex-associated protein-like, partial [Oncorhynchus keta]|uniref:BRD4-interacting chromatin-remodeling complex-associated protein-like n=1 Tax=Oncorhynchus keta TaxID=8018 RepID=UPI00227C784F
MSVICLLLLSTMPQADGQQQQLKLRTRYQATPSLHYYNNNNNNNRYTSSPAPSQPAHNSNNRCTSSPAPSQPAPQQQQQQIHLQPRPPPSLLSHEPDVPLPLAPPNPPRSSRPLCGAQFTASQVGDPGVGCNRPFYYQAKWQQQSQPQPQQHGGQQQDVPAPQSSVLVKTPATAFNDVLSGAQVTQGVAPAGQPGQQSLHQVQVGGMESVSGLSQMTSTQQTFSPGLAPLQTQTAAMKMHFSMAKPSKEARMLEQLRKQQGSVLHPDYSSSFQCFEDTLTHLVPYHLYQGTATPPHDYHRGTHTLTTWCLITSTRALPPHHTTTT